MGLELDRLEVAGIIEQVTHSEWAAPIVAVPKKVSVTINQVLQIDQYPLPKPEDLFATLAGGNKFTTLDLSHLQLKLSEESFQYTTIKHTPRPLSLQEAATF